MRTHNTKALRTRCSPVRKTPHIEEASVVTTSAPETGECQALARLLAIRPQGAAFEDVVQLLKHNFPTSRGHQLQVHGVVALPLRLRVYPPIRPRNHRQILKEQLNHL